MANQKFLVMYCNCGDLCWDGPFNTMAEAEEYTAAQEEKAVIIEASADMQMASVTLTTHDRT